MQDDEAEFWTLEPTRSIRYAEVESPIATNGNPIRRGTVGETPTSAYANCVDGRTKLADCVRTANGILILSPKAASVFRSHEFPDLRYVPLEIRDTGGVVVDVYEVILTPYVEFVDIDRSSFVPISKATPRLPWYFTETPIVWRGALAGLDYAESIEVARVCSKLLKNSIERHKLTNFSFEPLAVQ